MPTQAVSQSPYSARRLIQATSPPAGWDSLSNMDWKIPTVILVPTRNLYVWGEGACVIEYVNSGPARLATRFIIDQRMNRFRQNPSLNALG